MHAQREHHAAVAYVRSGLHAVHPAHFVYTLVPLQMGPTLILPYLHNVCKCERLLPKRQPPPYGHLTMHTRRTLLRSCSRFGPPRQALCPLFPVGRNRISHKGVRAARPR